jgi:hypothetical protein
MTRALHNLPILTGAIASDWYEIGGPGHPGDIGRVLTWSRHDVAEVCIVVAGAQIY